MEDNLTIEELDKIVEEAMVQIATKAGKEMALYMGHPDSAPLPGETFLGTLFRLREKYER